MQFCMHFREACQKLRTINTLSSELNDNNRQLSRLSHHVPAMYNAKVYGTCTTLGSSTHSHNTGLIHTLTQHWAHPEKIYHQNTPTCHDDRGGDVIRVWG